MARLPDRILRCVRAIEADLRSPPAARSSRVASLPASLADLFGALKVMVYGIVSHGRGHRLEWGFEAGPATDFLPMLGAYLAGAPARWAAFDAPFPAPPERNVVLSLEDVLDAAGLRSRRDVPLFRDLYPKAGLDRADEMRALVCDGACLLGVVSVFREEPFGVQSRRVLQRLVPALRQCWSHERALADAMTTRALLEVALEVISELAFVVDPSGSVVNANAAGRQWLQRQGIGGAAELTAAVRRGRGPGFQVINAGASGGPVRCLVVGRGTDHASDVRAARAATRWRLTGRQAEVLGLLAEGLTTRAIAAAMGVSERSVEVHLTAVFEKANVENRAELIAAVWRGT